MSRTLSVALAFIFIFVAAFAASFIAGQKKPAEVKPQAKTVKMVKSRTVKNEDLTTRLELTGRLLARQKVELFSEVGGLLLPNGSRFKEGNYFKEGSPLLKIDKKEPELNLLAQKSSLMNQITLMLPDLKSDYPKSFPAWEQYLKEMNVKEVLAPLPEPVSDQERYFISARNLYNLYYAIQAQEERLKKYVIKAPFNGVVAASMINEGTLVRVGQKLGDFMNAYSYELEAAVDESEIDLVNIGSTVKLFAEGGEKAWNGKVIRISDVVDPATQTIKVFIATSGKGLKEGMYLSATVEGSKIPDSFEISRNLLINQESVFVIEDSVLSLKGVDPVYVTSTTAIVKGLEDGMLLMDETLSGAFEGLKVGIR